MVEAKKKGSSHWWWFDSHNKGNSNRSTWLNSTLAGHDLHLAEFYLNISPFI